MPTDCHRPERKSGHWLAALFPALSLFIKRIRVSALNGYPLSVPAFRGPYSREVGKGQR
jgi:hypothetical protein